MMTVDTHISAGYIPLLEVFAQANSLNLTMVSYTSETRIDQPVTHIVMREYVRISYDAESDTGLAITLMSIRHLGFENMLCDFLIKCNVPADMIPVGKFVMRKNSKQLEDEWQQERKRIGLI